MINHELWCADGQHTARTTMMQRCKNVIDGDPMLLHRSVFSGVLHSKSIKRDGGGKVIFSPST